MYDNIEDNLIYKIADFFEKNTDAMKGIQIQLK